MSVMAMEESKTMELMHEVTSPEAESSMHVGIKPAALHEVEIKTENDFLKHVASHDDAAVDAAQRLLVDGDRRTDAQRATQYNEEVETTGAEGSAHEEGQVEVDVEETANNPEGERATQSNEDAETTGAEGVAHEEGQVGSDDEDAAEIPEGERATTQFNEGAYADAEEAAEDPEGERAAQFNEGADAYAEEAAAENPEGETAGQFDENADVDAEEAAENATGETAGQFNEDADTIGEDAGAIPHEQYQVETNDDRDGVNQGSGASEINEDAQTSGEEPEANKADQEQDMHMKTKPETEDPVDSKESDTAEEKVSTFKQASESAVAGSGATAEMPRRAFEDDTGVSADGCKDIHVETECVPGRAIETLETDALLADAASACETHIATPFVDSEAGVSAKIDAERPDVPNDNDSETTEGVSTGDARADTDATASNSDGTASAPEDPSGESVVPPDSAQTQAVLRVLHVQAALPQDLSFVAPPGCVSGQALIVQGPHGPLQVQAPPNVKPGQQITMRLGSPLQHEVFVPAGAKPGQKVTFHGANDEQLEAVVPPGKRPGQVFHVSPPVVMIPVPLGAVEGDQLAFVAPNGRVMMVPVPQDVPHGQYLSVQY